MESIILRASFFLLMIVIAYALKRTGVLKKEDGISLARIVMNVTLPCAILVGFRTFVFEWSYMVIPVISLLAEVLMLAVGYAITRGRSRDERIFYMMCLPAYNIGNFTLPFISGMLGSAGIIAACLFDMGNSPMCLGLNFAFTALAIGSAAGRNPLRQLLTVFTKPSFIVYIVMLLLSASGLSLPDAVFDFAGLISPANGPMAMVMVGLMLEFRFDRSKVTEAVAVNAMRLVLAAAIAALFFMFAPFSYEIRKAVAITAFAPIASASPAFVAELKGDVALVGFASTLSIISALVIIPLLVVLL